jgi:hypothetical protein
MVGTSPIGAVFFVDGVSYVTTQTFTWPQGSKHIIQFSFTLDASGNSLGYQLSTDGKTEYTFGGWTAAGTTLAGGAPLVTVTADPTIPSVIAALSELYQVVVSFPNSSTTTACSGAPGTPTATGFQDGVVYFNGGCISTTTTVYLAAGSLPLLAFPYPGFSMAGRSTIHSRWLPKAPTI